MGRAYSYQVPLRVLATGMVPNRGEHTHTVQLWIATHDSYLDRLAAMQTPSITAPNAATITSNPPIDSPDYDPVMQTDMSDFDFSQMIDMPSPPTSVDNPINAMLPRHLLNRIIDFFLTYFYPLVPLPHRPTFSRDLEDKREERAGEEEWITMVYGIIGFTVVQAPCQKLGMSKGEAKDLVERCCQAIGSFLSTEFSNEQATCTRCKCLP